MKIVAALFVMICGFMAGMDCFMSPVRVPYDYIMAALCAVSAIPAILYLNAP